jgi:hypothetical protein
VVDRQPRRDLARAVLEQPTVWMDPVCAGGERAGTELAVIVLADREDRAAGGGRAGDRRDPVVGPRRQVDDDMVDLGEDRLETRDRADGDRLGAGTANEVGESRRPDQVIGEDGDPGAQSSIPAR